jgi:hypothetical protein
VIQDHYANDLADLGQSVRAFPSDPQRGKLHDWRGFVAGFLQGWIHDACSFRSGCTHQEPEMKKPPIEAAFRGDLGSEYQLRASSVFTLKAPWRLLPGCRQFSWNRTPDAQGYYRRKRRRRQSDKEADYW